jgi:hypothetical protein
MVFAFLIALPVAVAAVTVLFSAIGRLATTPDLSTNRSLRVAGLLFVVWFLVSFCVMAAAMAFSVSAHRASIVELLVASTVFALVFGVLGASGPTIHARHLRSLERRIAWLQGKQAELSKRTRS